MALQAREASAEHKGNVDMNIMDVNQAEVIARLSVTAYRG